MSVVFPWFLVVISDSMCDMRNRCQAHRPQCYVRCSSRPQTSNGFRERGRGRHCQSCRCVTGNTTNAVAAVDALPQVACVGVHNLNRCGKLGQHPKVSGRESFPMQKGS